MYKTPLCIFNYNVSKQNNKPKPKGKLIRTKKETQKTTFLAFDLN